MAAACQVSDLDAMSTPIPRLLAPSSPNNCFSDLADEGYDDSRFSLAPSLYSVQTSKASFDGSRLSLPASIYTTQTDGMSLFSNEEAIIPVIGPSGAGKSSFIDATTRSYCYGVGTGHNLKSYTTEIVSVSTNHPRMNRLVTFVDTPGFDETDLSEAQVLERIVKWKEENFPGVTFAGILYLHPISDDNMGAATLGNLRIYRKLCGNNALQKIFFVTTFWDEVDKDVGPLREKELTESFWRTMVRNRSQVVRFDQSSESAWAAVDLLLSRDQRPAVLHEEPEPISEDRQASTEMLNSLKKLMAQQQMAKKNLLEEEQEYDPQHMKDIGQGVADLVRVSLELDTLGPLPPRRQRRSKSVFARILG